MYPNLPKAELANIPRILKEYSSKLEASPQFTRIFLEYDGNFGQFSLGELGIHGLGYLQSVYDRGARKRRRGLYVFVL